MSKGPKQYTVVKVVRMTAEEAAFLRALASSWKMSESGVVRTLLKKRSGKDLN
jgi:hypothetical protein